MKVYGEGSIQQVDKVARYKCRRWRLFVKTEEGMRTRRFDGTLTEAKAALKDFIEELTEEIPCSETFRTYSEHWAQEREDSGDLSPNTIERDWGRVNALNREFGKETLDALTTARIRSGLISIRKKGASGKPLSGTYVNGLHTCLGQILGQAETDGLILSNPCKLVPRPKRDTKEKAAASKEELAAMLDKLDEMQLDGRVMAIYLMATMGLRRGEACGLYWEDVDEDYVTVRRAMREADGSIGQPKTTSGVRKLPMPPRMKAKMQEWEETFALYGYTGETVCCATNGKPLRPQNLYKWWETHKEELGVPGLTLHQLRHSNLTLMARNCKSVFDLQRWAGWSSIEPAKIYVHQNDDELRNASAMLDL